MENRNSDNNHRCWLDVLKYRKIGHSFKECGKHFSISSTRAMQICRQAISLMDDHNVVAKVKKLSKSEALNCHINELCLDTRTHCCLLNAGIKIIKDVVSRDRLFFLLLKNFGPKSLAVLEDALGKYGLRLSKPPGEHCPSCGRRMKHAGN
jgi:DNA-directed RNA polymerase alpha subunit